VAVAFGPLAATRPAAPRLRLWLAGLFVAALGASGCGGEFHPRADTKLPPLADHSRIVARADDCRDVKDVAYIKNDICIRYEVAETPMQESASAFLRHEVQALDGADWRLFSPSEFDFGKPVVGRIDLFSHDCLLVGPPERTLMVMYREDASVGPAPTFWEPILSALSQAREHHHAVIGLQFYPGPANEPDHEAC
jgi:hypothetical protein